MNHRLVTLESRTSYTADQTKIIDVRLQDPISQLILDTAMSVDAAGSMTLHPVACISKIELVDGSDVLFSLSGLEAEALDWYNHKTFRSNYNYALNGGDTQRFIGLNFGRKLWDPQMALDPKKFRNLQLKVTMDVGAGGISNATVKLGVWAACFDEKSISPLGFLMAKEIKDYNMSASGHEYTQLPTDFPYRKLLIRQQTAGTEPNQLLANIKISEEEGKRSPYDHATEDILRAIMAEYPSVREEYFFAIASANRYLMIAPTTRVTAQATPWGTTAVANSMTLYDGDGGRLKTIGTPSETNCMVAVQGWLPHGMWAIPFGDQDDPGDWYNTPMVKSLKLDLTAASGASASTKTQICVEQHRKY